MSYEMKVPKNRTSRLADDVWLAGEAIARHYGMAGTRDGFETAVRAFVVELARNDTRFADIWTAVKEEGIDDEAGDRPKKSGKKQLSDDEEVAF